MSTIAQKRILIVDDNAAIHEDFRKIFAEKTTDKSFDMTKAALFGNAQKTDAKDDQEVPFVIDSAYQGEEALELVRKSKLNGDSYALAFVDIRMPPGWDGVVTIKEIWKVDPEIQMVICTAHSDYSMEETSSVLKNSDNFLILKKPFDIIEIRQLASALTKKWEQKKQIQYQIDNLQSLVNERTAAVEESMSLIKATLESTQEGIIAVSLDKKITLFNQLFLKLWGIPEKFVNSNTANIVFQRLSQQVEESALFLKTVAEMAENPKENSVREWKLKSGKVIEIYVQPRYLHDEIAGCVFSFRDVTERKILEGQLLHQATHDNLTGLSNRVLLFDRIQQAIFLAKRNRLQVGILLLDLDNFKEVNDFLGHDAGDELLKIVATKLSGYVRESDTVTRMGGDEFVVVLTSHSHEEDLMAKAWELRELFVTPCEIKHHKLTITTSIGVSIYPKNGEDPATLLKNADAAMYYAKEVGKNNVQFYMSELNEFTLQRAQLTTDLRQALKNNELFLYYQPLVSLQSGKTTGVEALLRWEHPTLGSIPPTRFIPLAEKTGLILSIGEWVLKTACLQCKEWQDSFYPELHVAVNISEYQFRQENFVESVLKILKETEFDPKFLEFEITENIFMENSQEIFRKMLKLKEIGIHFSIDNFGTGSSSLNYLKFFPFEKLKIDKSFIDNLSSNKENQSIVETIISMTKTMGLEVLAEGVETQDQVEFLREYHSTQVQGYYFSTPLDVTACEVFLKIQELPKKV